MHIYVHAGKHTDSDEIVYVYSETNILFNISFVNAFFFIPFFLLLAGFSKYLISKNQES